MRSGLRVALVYNLKYNVAAGPGAPPDALAEYDSIETIQALEDTLLAGGHRVICLEGDETLLDTVRQTKPDMCFNIAKGLRGDARESQVPALLEMLNPVVSDLCIMAKAEGMRHTDPINDILRLAVDRDAREVADERWVRVSPAAYVESGYLMALPVRVGL
jgi:hypothetical protein